MSGIVVGNTQTIKYIVNSMVLAKESENKVEAWILRKYLMEVVEIRIRQKELSCKTNH